MILTRLGPEVPFYRALTPRWAYQPESGAGAAAVGGRFNRPGIEARYLAETAAGALAEYQQESPLLPPATLATYLVTAERVVDFSGGYKPEQWSPIWAEAYCNWKGLAFLEDVEPPSWVIGDLVRAASIAGILYRSAREPAQRCLVLYPEFADQFSAPVYDPDGRLPLDAASWAKPR
jgi:RES domain-containing protein